ncbi:MAG: hypothetical protein CM1200mP2_56670 [Planctomycetaceae bacterium]|nr:MAG: hypothetical protein CM1200mP2_56670 [Planctomycetaceae bacterium]
MHLAACRVGDSELVELDRMIGLESLALPLATSDGIAPTLISASPRGSNWSKR